MIILSAGARLSGLSPMLITHSRQACRVAGPRLRLLWRAAPSSGFLAGKHGGDSAMAFFPGSLCCLAPGSGIPPAAARSFPGARKQITRRSGPVQKAPGEQPGRRSRPPAVCSAGASLARRSCYWCRSFSRGHENGLAPCWAGLPRYAQRLPAWEQKERMGRPRARPRQRLCAPATSSGRADSNRPSGGGRFHKPPRQAGKV